MLPIDMPMMSIISNNATIQDAASLVVTKLAMDTSKQNAANMNEMLKTADPNLGNKLDVRAWL